MYLDLSSTKILIPTSSILRSRRSFVQICFQNDACPFLVPFVVVVVVVVGLSHVHFLESRELNNFGFLPIAHPICKYTRTQINASYECNGRNQPALTTKLQISFFQSQPPFPYVLKIYQYCTPYTSTCWNVFNTKKGPVNTYPVIEIKRTNLNRHSCRGNACCGLVVKSISMASL